MEALDYKKENGLILVKISFELKDLFKGTFKTAKWNNWKKSWEIKDNTRNENKLKIWIEEARSVNEKINKANEAHDSEELAGAKLEKLKKEFETIRNNIEYAKKSLFRTQKIIEEQKQVEEVLKQKNEELALLKTQQISLTKSLEETLSKREEELKDIINVDEILNTIQEMRDIQTGKDKNTQYLSHNKTRQKWKEKKEPLDLISNKLEELGLESKGIDRVVYSEYNHSERGEYYNVTRSDLLDIVSI